MSEACSPNDLVERNVSWLLWRVPMLAFVIGAFLAPPARPLLWVPAFLVREYSEFPRERISEVLRFAAELTDRRDVAA